MNGSSDGPPIRPGAARTGLAVGRGEEVLDAAARVFARQGYDATSVDDIADAMGSTKGRVYHYYRSKADLLLGVLAAGARKLTEAVQPIAESTELSPSDRLYRMAKAHALTLMTDNEYQRVALRSLNAHVFEGSSSRQIAWETVLELRDQYESLFRSVVAQGVDAGEFRSRDIGLTVRGLLGTLNWITVWYRPAATDARDLSDPETVAAELARFVLSGARGLADAPAADG